MLAVTVMSAAQHEEDSRGGLAGGGALVSGGEVVRSCHIPEVTRTTTVLVSLSECSHALIIVHYNCPASNCTPYISGNRRN